MTRALPILTRELAAAVRRGDAAVIDRCLVELHRRPARLPHRW